MFLNLPVSPERMRQYHHHTPLLHFLLYWAASTGAAQMDFKCHIGIHSIINAATLEEPVSPSIVTTTTVPAAPTPPEPAAESNTTRPRPPSGNSTTTTGSSIRYTSHLHARTRNCHTHNPYRSTWVVQVPSSQKNRRGKGNRTSKESVPLTNSSVARSRSPYAPLISYATFRDDDLHMTMQIPGPISMESMPRWTLSSWLRIPLPQSQLQVER